MHEMLRYRGNKNTVIFISIIANYMQAYAESGYVLLIILNLLAKQIHFTNQ